METKTKIFTRVSTAELHRKAKDYILNAIDNENYENKKLVTTEEKLQFLYDTFKAEYGWGIARYGEQGAMREWLMGLPSAFNIDFENYKILQIAKEWGSIPQDATEAQEDKILNNWFNFIATKTLMLIRKYR